VVTRVAGVPGLNGEAGGSHVLRPADDRVRSSSGAVLDPAEAPSGGVEVVVLGRTGGPGRGERRPDALPAAWSRVVRYRGRPGCGMAARPVREGCAAAGAGAPPCLRP